MIIALRRRKATHGHSLEARAASRSETPVWETSMKYTKINVSTVAHQVELTTDTGTFVACVFTCTLGGEVTRLDIIGKITKANGDEESTGLEIPKRTDAIEVALIRSIRNAALLWQGCSDRLDRGDRDSLALEDYEAICETIREGIAALLERFASPNYPTQHKISKSLYGSIITDLTVKTSTR